MKPEFPEETWENEIVCPYCQHKDGDSWEAGFKYDGDTWEDYTCGSCDKQFHVTYHLEVSYQCISKEEHEYECREHDKRMAELKKKHGLTDL